MSAAMMGDGGGGGASGRASRGKLWLGFGLMCVGVLVWVFAAKWAMGSLMSDPMFNPGATPEEMAAAMERTRPGDMMTRMMVGYGVAGMVWMGGLIVTVMGLIEYAGEVRRRG